MSRKSKIDPVLKIKAVEDILVGKKGGVCEVARELRVDESTVRGWRLRIAISNPPYLRVPGDPTTFRRKGIPCCLALHNVPCPAQRLLSPDQRSCLYR